MTHTEFDYAIRWAYSQHRYPTTSRGRTPKARFRGTIQRDTGGAGEAGYWSIWTEKDGRIMGGVRAEPVGPSVCRVTLEGAVYDIDVARAAE